MSEITMKSTKDQIFKALQDALQQANQSTAGKHDPVAEAKVKKDVETVSTSMNIVEDDFEGKILAVKRELSTALDHISFQLTDKAKALTTITEAISVQTNKLNELYGIEAEANTLIALVNAKDSLSQKLDAEYAEKKSTMDKELAHLQVEIKDTKAKVQEELEELHRQDNQKRRREEEEWKYSFERTKTKAQHELQDELDSKRRELEGNIRDVNLLHLNREKDITAREEKLAGVEKQIEDLNEQLHEVHAVVTKEVTEHLTTKFQHEKIVQEKEAEKERAILTHQIKVLQEALIKSENEKVSMSKKLDDAYTQVRELASKTVENSGDKKVNVALENVIREMSNKSQSK